jgi:recombination protein RecT
MENERQLPQVKEFFASEEVKKKFRNILGERAPQFLTSLLQVVGSNDRLKACIPATIFNAAATAATMNLPINQNLGFAWIIPYNSEAQFQMGYKGFIQLAQRSGQYLKLNVLEIFENQFKSWNELTEELVADFSVEGFGKIHGYCAYFELLNGYKKTVYWSRLKVEQHGKKYSKNYNGKNSMWLSSFDDMAKKTVLKNMLSKWGILSIEMQTAITVDQAVIKNEEGTEVYYPDNEVPDETNNDKARKASNLTEKELQELKTKQSQK